MLQAPSLLCCSPNCATYTYLVNIFLVSKNFLFQYTRTLEQSCSLGTSYYLKSEHSHCFSLLPVLWGKPACFVKKVLCTVSTLIWAPCWLLLTSQRSQTRCGGWSGGRCESRQGCQESLHYSWHAAWVVSPTGMLTVTDERQHTTASSIASKLCRAKQVVLSRPPAKPNRP